MADDADSKAPANRIDGALREAQVLYTSGRLGASCRELRAVVAFSAEALLAEIRRKVQSAAPEYVQHREGRSEPTIEQVASGVFRFTTEYRGPSGGVLSVSVEGLGQSEGEEVVRWVLAGRADDGFRAGVFTGRWEAETLTLPLWAPAPGPCLRVAISDRATRGDAEKLFSEESLRALSTLSIHARNLTDPVPQQFRELLTRSEPVGDMHPGSLLWRSRSLLALIREEWIRKVAAVLQRGLAHPIQPAPRIVQATWIESKLVATSSAVDATGSVDFVLSVDVDDDGVRKLCSVAKRDRGEWRERQIGGMLLWHRSAASGSEELVFPGFQARARIWVRAPRTGPSPAGVLLRYVEGTDLEALRSLLEDV